MLSRPIRFERSTILVPADFKEKVIDRYRSKTIEPVPTFGYKKVGEILIDAGHGGKDPGALSKRGVKEKNVVLDIAIRVKNTLQQHGFKVKMTRQSDVFLTLQERTKLASHGKTDLFVSIHANANHSRWIEGFEVYYLTESVDDNARALASAENSSLEINNQSFWNQPLSLKAMLWDLIYTENRKESIMLAKAICNSVSKQMKLKMLGVKGAPFAVLKGTQMPAVLVAIGYISNSEGERKLRDTEYRKRMAEAIAEGIFQFKNSSEGKNIKE